MARNKQISKNQKDLRMRRLDLWDRFVPWLGGALVTAASGLPLWVIGHWVHDIAGKTTNFNAVVSVSIVINVALVVTLAVQSRRRGKQSATLEQLRERLSVYEQRGLEERGVGRTRSPKAKG